MNDIVIRPAITDRQGNGYLFWSKRCWMGRFGDDPCLEIATMRTPVTNAMWCKKHAGSEDVAL